MTKITKTATPFWFAEYRSAKLPSVWKKVWAVEDAAGWHAAVLQHPKETLITLTGDCKTLHHLYDHMVKMTKLQRTEWKLRGPLPHRYEDIIIAPPGADYNRFKVAHEIQGACNPSGVARELVRVIAAAQNDPNYTGTDFVRSDAAVVAVIDKLSSLCMKEAIPAHGECRKKAKTDMLSVNEETGTVSSADVEEVRRDYPDA